MSARSSRGPADVTTGSQPRTASNLCITRLRAERVRFGQHDCEVRGRRGAPPNRSRFEWSPRSVDEARQHLHTDLVAVSFHGRRKMLDLRA